MKMMEHKRILLLHFVEEVYPSICYYKWFKKYLQQFHNDANNNHIKSYKRWVNTHCSYASKETTTSKSVDTGNPKYNYIKTM